eukprot:COSAG06_NODE_3190_length_5707_cov_57.591655_8_plen_170_part_00
MVFRYAFGSQPPPPPPPPPLPPLPDGFDYTYDVAGCSNPAHCGTVVVVQASCTSGDSCPGGRDTDPTLCDNAPVFQAGGPDGPVLFRYYFGGSTFWAVGPSDRLNDCDPDYVYLVSDSNPGPLGDAPTAFEYNNGAGWRDYDNGAYSYGTITVTAGDGSATGGGGGGGH